jgi:MoaA/NifB/PqqE/SkfB family radical SAM enzyme
VLSELTSTTPPADRLPMDYSAVKAANKALNYEEARRGLARIKSRPLFFWFDIYGPCNLKCVHCGFHKEGRTSEQEVSEAVYAEVLKELMPSAYECNLGGTNWGEMTISKNFDRFLLDCRAFGVKVNLTTNGTRMNDSWIGDLVDVAKVVGFSMEGMNAEFEKMRGFPWQRFVSNIEKLVDARRAAAKTFKIEWRYCAHADSVHQLPDMIRTAKTLGIDRIQVMPLVPYVKIQKYKNLSYHRSLANQYFALARSVARELDFTINIPRDYGTGDFTSPLVKIQKKEEAGFTPPADDSLHMVNCYRPWQTCAINELGSVKPCCIYWRPMGSLAEGDFDSVWNGRKYRALRRSVNTKPDSICHDCRMPSHEAEEGRVAGELRPSMKQLVVQFGQSLKTRQSVRFTDVLDPRFDPRHPGPAA